MEFKLSEIHANTATAEQYLRALQPHLPCSLPELIGHAEAVCPELRTFCAANERSFGARDKGSVGKIVEFRIFGRLPNSESTPDLTLGDVKATHVKKMAKGYNAKERLTLTNVGATSNYANLQHILDNELEANSRWAKVKQGILVVLEHSTDNVMALFHYDITSVPAWMETVRADYEKIRDCVRAEAVSQTGQTFLHIHPHGSKASSTRAFGFTNKFVTRLICHYTGRTLVESGRSFYFTG